MKGSEAKEKLFELVDASSLTNEQKMHLRYYVGRISDETSQSAKDQAMKAIIWARENSILYNSLKSIALYAAVDPSRAIYKDGKRVGYQRIMRSEIYTLARQRGWDITLCEQLKRDHNMWSTLSRLIIMQEPLCARVLVTAKSKVDEIDLERMWEEHGISY